MEDIAKYGLMPELLGRIGTILTISPLGLEDYRQLLNAQSGSLQRKYCNYLENLYGVDFEITSAGADLIAQKCMKASSGARAVNPLVNDMMRGAIADLENDESICKVILDANGDACTIRYSHGCRKEADRNTPVAETEELRWHTVRAKNTPALIRKLCRYYRNAEGNLGILEQLEAFLGCSIPYLHRGCRHEEFNLEALNKLAGATGRTGRKSPFEDIMCRAFYVPKEAYSKFGSVYSPWLSKNLVWSLKTIGEYLQEKHGPCRIRFEVPKGK